MVAQAQHTLATAQATASLPDLIAAVRWPLLAVSIISVAVLLTSIPISANLAKKSQRQGPQHLHATAAGSSKITSANVPADTPSAGVSELTAPGGMVSSFASDGEASSKPVNGGKEGPAEQPDEDTMSEPSTLPSNHSSASEAASPPQTLSEMVGSGDGELEASSSTTDGQGEPEQQLPGAAAEVGPDRKKGFFRDIKSDCLPRCRQRQFTFGPKLCELGKHRIAGMQKPWLASSCVCKTSCLRHSITCRRLFVLR